VCQDIHNRFPKVKRKRLTREEIRWRCHLQVPEEFDKQNLDILCKHQDTLSIDKYDLGLAKDFKHKIHLKTQDPVYRKQFKTDEVTVERNDIMGIIEIEEDEMYPLRDEAVANICASIKSNIPSTPRMQLNRDDIARQCNLQVLE
jgi:hypothetical protein